jgi:hypothetical protein
VLKKTELSSSNLPTLVRESFRVPIHSPKTWNFKPSTSKTSEASVSVQLSQHHPIQKKLGEARFKNSRKITRNL